MGGKGPTSIDICLRIFEIGFYVYFEDQKMRARSGAEAGHPFVIAA